MDFEDVLKHFEKPANDIKAEAIFAQLVKNGFDPAKFIVRNKSTFHRPFGRDVDRVYIDESSKIEDFISVELNRNGLYDYLPEGLFHQPIEPFGKSTQLEDWIKQARKNKEVEDESRKFFLPIEHEAFLCRMELEHIEQSILENLQIQDNANFLFSFWGLRFSRQLKGLNLLVHFFPLLQKIVGNLDATRACYEIITGERVTIERIFTHHHSIEIENPFTLHKTYLGQNSIIGNRTSSSIPLLRFIIGPLKNFSLSDYLQNGMLYQTLQLLHSYFLPVEAEVEEIIIPSESEQNFVLNELNENNRLGYIIIS